jgi:sugar O-acyltransferase (sialic acid O-acetyltransferase NeuD family)
MNKRVILVGGGAHALSIGTLMAMTGYTITGYLDRAATDLEWLYVGTDESALKHGHHEVDGLVMGIGFDTALRTRLFLRFTDMGFRFLTYVHPSSTVASNATLEAGSVVFPNCFVGAKAVLGRNVTLCTGCIVDHEAQLGDHCYLSPGVTVAGRTVLGDQCRAGTNAAFVSGVRIARDTTVGAGTLILRDIGRAGETYAGVPGVPLERISQAPSH